MVTAKNTSPVRRAARLINMGAGLAGAVTSGYLSFSAAFFGRGKKPGAKKQMLKNSRSQEDSLGASGYERGRIMKIGQMSQHADGFSSILEMIAELSALQKMQAPPMHPSLMRAQFKKLDGLLSGGCISFVR